MNSRCMELPPCLRCTSHNEFGFKYSSSSSENTSPYLLGKYTLYFFFLSGDCSLPSRLSPNLVFIFYNFKIPYLSFSCSSLHLMYSIAETVENFSQTNTMVRLRASYRIQSFIQFLPNPECVECTRTFTRPCKSLTPADSLVHVQTGTRRLYYFAPSPECAHRTWTFRLPCKSLTPADWTCS